MKRKKPTLEQILKGMGYSRKQASYLANHEFFHHKRKTKKELDKLFSGISKIYKCGLNKVKKAVLKWPYFAGYDHERVVREANEEYGDEDRVKEAILKHPQFAGYDHKRVVRKASKEYGNEDKIKEAILKWPPFAGYDHKRVVREANEEYGDEDKVKEAILKHPQFASYNHKRVVRQKSRLGILVDLSEQEVIDKILDNPVLAGYSARRYIAGLDIANKLIEEGFEPDEQMLNAFFRYAGKSPYVPGTNRLRISKVENGEEPPLLVYMRKSLKRINKK